MEQWFRQRPATFLGLLIASQWVENPTMVRNFNYRPSEGVYKLRAEILASDGSSVQTDEYPLQVDTTAPSLANVTVKGNGTGRFLMERYCEVLTDFQV